MPAFAQDVRYGFRALFKSPGFSAIAVGTLALGIGLNTSLFSVVNAVLLQPFPVQEAHRLVFVFENNPGIGLPRASVSMPNYLDWKKQARSFEQLALGSGGTATLTGGGEPRSVARLRTSHNVLELVRERPALGRGFTAEEDRPGGPAVAMISYELWQSRFGGDPQVLGKSVLLDLAPHTIVGVLPRNFGFPQMLSPSGVIDFFTPAGPAAVYERGYHEPFALGRLRDGVSLEAAQAEMDVIARQLSRAYPATNTGWGVTVQPVHELILGNVRAPLMLLMSAVAFVLLIACANLANLLLSRGVARGRELAVRFALGASPWRLIRQLLTESLGLALIGGIIGLVLALWVAELIARLNGVPIPRLAQVRVDPAVLAFTFLVSALTGLVFGAVPALQMTRGGFEEALKEAGRGGSGGRRRYRLSSILAAAEVALAMVLLVGAGLMVRSLERLHSQDPGFRPAYLAALGVNLPASLQGKNEQGTAFLNQLLERAQAVPGIESAALESDRWVWEVAITGRPYTPGRSPNLNCFRISSGYLKTMGIRLVRGRDLTAHDQLGAADVILTTEYTARRLWPGENPIGKSIELPFLKPWRKFQVVGVTGDVKFAGWERDPGLQVFFSRLQLDPSGMNLLVRSKPGIDPAQHATALRSVIWSLDKDQPVGEMQAVGAVLLDNSSGTRRFATLLLTGFSILALLLAAIGTYGVIAYSVSQRTREIGIRMALGADASRVKLLVLRHAAIVAGSGIGVGLAASLGLTRLIRGMLFGVTAADPLTFGGVAVLLVSVILAACYVPVRRALRLNPIETLRCE
jgi:predicted permease